MGQPGQLRLLHRPAEGGRDDVDDGQVVVVRKGRLAGGIEFGLEVADLKKLKVVVRLGMRSLATGFVLQLCCLRGTPSVFTCASRDKCSR